MLARSAEQDQESSRMKLRVLGAIVIAASLCLMIFSPSSQAVEKNTKIPTATRFQPAATTLQAIVVKNTSWRSSYATVEVWSRRTAASRWIQWAPTTGRVGRSGIKIVRSQNDGSTPAGMFGVLWGFGLSAANPNAKGMQWRQITSNDSWVGDPNHRPTYNTFQTWFSPGWDRAESERLWNYRYGQYRYAWVIDYNRPRLGTRPASEPQPILTGPGSGNGIFLHVNGSGSTEGCVSIPRSKLAAWSAWFRASSNPVLIIGEDDWLKG
ncbi:MAG TPA: cell wall-binding protein [Actinomycetes bacterium]|nr:cell wall-binding protein [Actinomycetes bacterium]